MDYHILVIISWTTSSISSSRSSVFFACSCVLFVCISVARIVVLCFMFGVSFVTLLLCYVRCICSFACLSFCSSDGSQRVMLRCVLLPYMLSCLICKLPYLEVACCVACILVMRTHCLTRRMLCLPNLGIMCLVA